MDLNKIFMVNKSIHECFFIWGINSEFIWGRKFYEGKLYLKITERKVQIPRISNYIIKLKQQKKFKNETEFEDVFEIFDKFSEINYLNLK